METSFPNKGSIAVSGHIHCPHFIEKLFRRRGSEFMISAD
jgi:hypothetical protein